MMLYRHNVLFQKFSPLLEWPTKRILFYYTDCMSIHKNKANYIYSFVKS